MHDSLNRCGALLIVCALFLFAGSGPAYSAESRSVPVQQDSQVPGLPEGIAPDRDRPRVQQPEQDELPGMLTRGPVTLRVVIYPGPEQTVGYDKAAEQVSVAVGAILQDSELSVHQTDEGEPSVYLTGSNRLEFSARTSNPSLLDAVVWEATAELSELREKGPTVYSHIRNELPFLEQAIFRVYLGPPNPERRRTRLFFGPYYFSDPPDLSKFLEDTIERDAPAWQQLAQIWSTVRAGDRKLEPDRVRELVEEAEMHKGRVRRELRNRVRNAPEDRRRLIEFISIHSDSFEQLYNGEDYQNLVDANLDVDSLLRYAEARIRQQITRNHPGLSDFKFMVHVVIEGETSRLK